MRTMNDTLKTEYGTVKLNNNDYYVVTSAKEGNNGKLWHRLVYEDFWGVTLPKEVIIHHKDENKHNNCILNLEAMTRETHQSLHNKCEKNSFYGKKHSKKTRELLSQSLSGENNYWYGKPRPINTCKKISENTTTTGYFRVCKEKRDDIKQGFRWRYAYVENGKPKSISSVDINQLKRKVLEKGLEWIKFEEEDLT